MPLAELSSAFIECAGQSIKQVAGLYRVQTRKQRYDLIEIALLGQYPEALPGSMVAALYPFPADCV
ncbi:hypothetical protein D3C76_1539300 [compost metagenome]